MTSGPDVPRALPHCPLRRSWLHTLDRILGDDDKTVRAVSLMKPVLVTIAIVAVSSAVIAVAAGGATSLALMILVCTGTGTALYRRLTPSNLAEPGEVRSSSDQSRS